MSTESVELSSDDSHISIWDDYENNHGSATAPTFVDLTQSSTRPRLERWERFENRFAAFGAAMTSGEGVDELPPGTPLRRVFITTTAAIPTAWRGIGTAGDPFWESGPSGETPATPPA